MSISKEMRDRVYARYSGHCAYCGCDVLRVDFHVDHIHPQYARGLDDFENLNPSCRRCNNFKAIWTVEQFRHELSKQIERCRKRSVNFRNAERYGLVKVLGNEIVFYFERTVPTSTGNTP